MTLEDIFREEYGGTLPTERTSTRVPLEQIMAEELGGPNRVKSMQKNRVNIATTLQGPEFSPGDNLLAKAGKLELNLATNALKTLGGGGQYIESVMSAPVTAVTQGENPFKAVADAATLQRTFEWGDTARNLGAPEAVASGLGLLASGYTDPAALGASVVQKTASNIGKVNANKWLNKIWQSGAREAGYLNKDAAKYAVADKMAFMDPKNMKGDPFKRGLVYEFGQDLTQDVGDKVYRSSSEAWKELADRSHNIAVGPDLIQAIKDEVGSVADSSLMKSGDRTIFKRAMGVGNETLEGEVELGVLDQLLNKARSAADKEGKTAGGVTLSDVIELQKDFMAKKGNIAARVVGRKINDVIEKFSAAYPELGIAADAVRKSRLWYEAEDALDELGLGVSKVRTPTKQAALSVDRAGSRESRLLGLFTDEKRLAEDGLNRLEALYASNGLDPTVLREASLGIRRANIAHTLAPEGARGGNISRLMALPTAFAIAAALDPVLGRTGASYALGALGGSAMAMTQTSPRAYAKASQLLKNIDKLKANPMMRTVAELNQRASSASAGRLGTLREFETQQTPER